MCSSDLDFRGPFDTLSTSATVKDGAAPAVTLRVIGRERMAAVQ